MAKQKQKLGMYGKMPIVKIGCMEVSQFTDAEGEKRVWLQITDEEGMEINGAFIDELGNTIKEWFNKNF